MQLFKASSLYLVIMLMALGVQAQQLAPILSLKQAVEIALKNNFNIRLAQNNVSISSNNVTLGNAGMLPQVTGSISQANSAQNITQTKSDGSVANLNGVQNSTFNYGLNLNWTVFNGLAMFASYNQLKQLNQYNQIASRDTVEATIAAVLANYYSLVYQKQQIGAQVGAIAISQTQLKFARDKFMAGRASQLDVLNAQVNLNTDTAAYITLLQNFDQSKTKLNQLLARGASTNFTVTDTITIDESLRLADVLNQAQTRNPAILLAQINQNVAQLSLQQVKAARYPVVGLNAGYAYTDAKTPAGFTHEQVSNGLSYGLTASVNIFNGLEQSR
jgi:outer membrane protein